jgi:hypothetical protein
MVACREKVPDSCSGKSREAGMKYDVAGATGKGKFECIPWVHADSGGKSGYPAYNEQKEPIEALRVRR